MSDVIIYSIGTSEEFSVDAQLGYEVTRVPETVVHRIIGREDPDITFKPTALRTGTFECLVLDQAQAEALAAALARQTTFQWASDGLPGITFVVTGEVRVRQTESLSSFTVGFSWTEVIP